MSVFRRQKGLALVEFTITAPFLLLMMLAGSELVRAFTQYTILADSVRDALTYAARQANLDSTNTPDLTAPQRRQIRNLVRFGNVAGTGAAVLPGLGDDQVVVSIVGGDDVQIVVAYPYRPMLGATLPSFRFGAAISSAFTLSITNRMRTL